VAIGEGQVLLPVERRDPVLAAAHVVPNRLAHGAVRLGHLGHAEPFLAQEAVDGVGGLRREKLPAGIGPEVFRSTRHVEGPRCYESQEQMLVHG
jgi:hypothetical protein